MLSPPEACVFSSYMCVYFYCLKYQVAFLLAFSFTAKAVKIFFILTRNKNSSCRQNDFEQTHTRTQSTKKQFNAWHTIDGHSRSRRSMQNGTEAPATPQLNWQNIYIIRHAHARTKTSYARHYSLRNMLPYSHCCRAHCVCTLADMHIHAYMVLPASFLAEPSLQNISFLKLAKPHPCSICEESDTLISNFWKSL
jgi:hypothetical protein